MNNLFFTEATVAAKKKGYFGHKCELVDLQTEVIPAPSPYAPFCERFIYHLRQKLTVSRNLKNLQYFRSNASFMREKLRHLGNPQFRNVIHPMSNFVGVKRMFMSFMWLCMFIAIPLYGSFLLDHFIMLRNYNHNRVGQCMLVLVEFVVVIDVLFNFVTGFIVKQTREIVLESRRIIMHYLKTYFGFDVFPIFAVCTLLVAPMIKTSTKLIIYLVLVLRLVRIRSSLEGLDEFLKIVTISKTKRFICLATLFYLIVIHWWACGLKLINVFRDVYDIPRNESWLTRVETRQAALEFSLKVHGSSWLEDKYFNDYLRHASVVTCYLLGAGVGFYKTRDAVEMAYFSLVTISGMLLYLFCLAALLQSVGLTATSEIKFEEIVSQTRKFMAIKRYPLRLRKRIEKYYSYKFDKRFFSEHQILNTLSEHLQMEILFHSCEALVEKVFVFRGLSRGAIGCILALLKQEIYLADDVIMSANDDTGTLYFILYGTCAVRLSSGREAMHIQDGSYFGENYELSRTSLTLEYRVVALEPCEIYTLSRDDVRYCCRQYPEIAHKIEKMATLKAKHYDNVFTEIEEDDQSISVSDIAAELRKGRIIEHGRKRRIHHKRVEV